jgi:acetate kinase
VHGGSRYSEPRRVDEAMLEELPRISSFAPKHLSSAIALNGSFFNTQRMVQQYVLKAYLW